MSKRYFDPAFDALDRVAEVLLELNPASLSMEGARDRAEKYLAIGEPGQPPLPSDLKKQLDMIAKDAQSALMRLTGIPVDSKLSALMKDPEPGKIASEVQSLLRHLTGRLTEKDGGKPPSEITEEAESLLALLGVEGSLLNFSAEFQRDMWSGDPLFDVIVFLQRTRDEAYRLQESVSGPEGRPKKDRAFRAARAAADDFYQLTGMAPTGTATGDFCFFLDKIFRALGVDGGASNFAKQAIREWKKLGQNAP